MGWTYEMAAWFALTEHRFEEAAMAAHAGQEVAASAAPVSNSRCKKPEATHASEIAELPIKL